jgi:fucose 4-O-acetylase-like acetyltransferase
MGNLKERDYMFDTFRGLLILSIPISHFTKMGGNQFGSMYLSGGFPQDTLFGFVYITINVFVMQAFMFLSGYLYKPVGKHEIIPFIRKKVLRLLLPYFVFSFLIMLTSGFFSLKELFQGFWHLWFLWALFWCFIFSVFIDYSKKYALIVLLCSFGMGGWEIELPAWSRDFVQWYYFFAFGAIVRSHVRVTEIIKRYYLWIPMVLSYVVTV